MYTKSPFEGTPANTSFEGTLVNSPFDGGYGDVIRIFHSLHNTNMIKAF
jgi:hypothetical protein